MTGDCAGLKILVSAVQSRSCPPASAGTTVDNRPVGGPIALAAAETASETTFETVSVPKPAPERGDRLTSAPRLRQTPFRRRLPRFTRAKRSHRPPVALQDRDHEILGVVNDYRLISTPQLLLLFDSESRDGLYRRLQRLFHHGYLERLGSNPNAPLVYGLGRLGAEVLGVRQPKRVADPYVAHQLMVSEFRVALKRASNRHLIEQNWRTVPATAPVNPDGFVGLRFPTRPEGQNRAFFFLEADRSTMPRARFAEKLLRYLVWRERGGHTDQLGIKTFRVLTVTKSEARLRSLVDLVSSLEALKRARAAFWFATIERLHTDAIPAALDAVWSLAEDSALHSILPG